MPALIFRAWAARGVNILRDVNPSKRQPKVQSTYLCLNFMSIFDGNLFLVGSWN